MVEILIFDSVKRKTQNFSETVTLTPLELCSLAFNVHVNSEENS